MKLLKYYIYLLQCIFVTIYRTDKGKNIKINFEAYYEKALLQKYLYLYQMSANNCKPCGSITTSYVMYRLTCNANKHSC